MASLVAVGVAQGAGLTFATSFGSGVLGFAITAAAGIIDQRLIFPAILGDETKTKPRQLLELQQMTMKPGAPLVWAIGRRVRVPVHVMFQSDKERSQNITGSKGGVPSIIKQLFADVGLLLNARQTHKLAQLVGSGKMLLFATRNLISISTSGMTASVDGGRLKLTMVDIGEEDFKDRFAVDDRIQLAGWVANGGPNINAGYWKVFAVTAHAGTTPSTIILDIYGGQSLAGLAATAGTPSSPASIFRVDDAFVEHSFTNVTGTGNRLTITFLNPAQATRFERAFQSGDYVRFLGWTPSGLNNQRFQVLGSNAFVTTLQQVAGSMVSGPYTSGTSTNAGHIAFWDPQTFVPDLFGANPALSFHNGTETQGEDSIFAQTEETGTIPGFRGRCYQTLDEMDLSKFGNQLPLLDALLEPDLGLTWPQAIALICGHGGLSPDEVDVSGVTTIPFEGYFLRGPIPGVTALQPLLVAGQIVTQERDGVIAFFDIENCEAVQVENGDEFSDLGCYAGSDTPLQIDKIQHGQLDEADLPTSINIAHQDPDNQYGDGSQHFGLRSPTAVEHDRVDEINLSNLVLTRKQARNLATTVMRRTWVNAHTVEVSLPVAYLDVLENDAITVTDDDDNVITARVIRREVGANMLVNLVAVREHLDLAVEGSPVQGVSSTIPPRVTPPSVLRTAVLDIAPQLQDHVAVPGIYIAACTEPGGHWAGAQVFESRDGGTTYNLVDTLHTETLIGLTTSSLAAGTLGETLVGGPFWDYVSTVDVQIAAPGLFGLTPRSPGEVLQGHNWLLIGDEILGFQNVTEPVEGTLRLANLLRGIRGTYHSAEASKASGQQVVMLSFFMASGVFRPLMTQPPIDLRFKIVPTGSTIADVPAISVIAQGYNARPFPVRQFTKTIGGSPFDATFAFTHWTRHLLPVGALGPYALDEPFEEYVMRIYDPTGTTLKRTKVVSARNSPGSPTLRSDRKIFVYPATEQTADGYTPASNETFMVEIEQGGQFGQGQTWRQEK